MYIYMCIYRFERICIDYTNKRLNHFFLGRVFEVCPLRYWVNPNPRIYLLERHTRAGYGHPNGILPVRVKG